MAQNKHKLASELATISERLLAMAKELGATSRPEPLPVLPDVAEKVALRVCLQHESNEPVPLGKLYRRGLCSMHYQKTLNRIARQEITEAQLVAAGYMAPESLAGRRTKSPDPVAELIRQKLNAPPDVHPTPEQRLGDAIDARAMARESVERVVANRKRKPKK